MSADELAAAVAELGALPMPVPVVPEPQMVDAGPVVQPLALHEAQIDALAAAGNRVVNDDTHEHLCMCDGWPEKCVSSGNYFMGAWDVDGLEAALPAVLGLWERMRGGELAALKARVAELEAERHSTNEALDDAVQALRADRASEPKAVGYPPALPWAALLDDEDRADFLDELAASAITHASSDVALAEVEKTCATWRLIGEAQHGHNTAPGPDAMTVESASAQALPVEPPLRGRARLDASAAVAAEATHWKRLGIEDPHDSPLHHDYRVGRDLPELGGLQ
ncbi:hypothetical protein PV733_36660 [Streptomyces europaeiscabiei]|uniref:hypothetical protein n=1 Tax=Streptomyces europaeiscabiei TaxID=146819 RepID=UPI0029A3FAAF|nr:hypothetical protein [Streptomyces europaeiscabiei]MDX3714363.1 hypothetical protein [Streptomyces europaeiscabiei]